MGLASTSREPPYLEETATFRYNHLAMDWTDERPILAQRYRLLQRLGRGGMAEVFRAHDLTLERTVAVKVLRAEYARRPAFRQRFHQEAKAAANLIHPNIVTVYDFGYDGERLFIVMEYVPGGTLAQRIRQAGRIPVQEALRLMVQACAGVGFAHRAGLVHCDIKPQNFLVTPSGRLKVADFGIARALASIHEGERQEVVWGSPQYMAPEVTRGMPPTAAADVYGLGVVLYQMLTGRLPFIADEPRELLRQHLETHPIPPQAFNPDLPPELEQVILTVLSKEPSRRYRTADQMGRVLLRFLREEDRRRSERTFVAPAAMGRLGRDLAASLSEAQGRLAGRRASPQGGAGEEPWSIDWPTLGLALLATLAVGGLVPLWLYVYLLYTR